MKKMYKPFLIGLFLASVALVSCDNATDDDCRDDSRCFEIPTSKGSFMSKNPSDPCPCA